MKANPLPVMTYWEWLRKAAHMAAFAPALLLPLLTPGQAISAAALMVAINTFLLPRLLPKMINRSEERGHGALEVILYPVAVLALIAAYGFPTAAGEVAGSAGEGTGLARPGWYLVPILAWFCLAFGDACAGIGCRLVRFGPALPWNRRKPVAGVALGLLGSCTAGYLLVRVLGAFGWIGFEGLGLARDTVGPLALALAGLLVLAALAETVWFGISDNLVVPFSVGVLLPLVPSPIFPCGGIPEFTGPLLLVPLGFGILANALGMLTLAGALAGTLMAFLLMAADPWLFLFLGGFFVLAVGATRWRYRSKEGRHIAEGRGGKRGAAQVFGAMGAAAWMTPLVHLAESAMTGAAATGVAGSMAGSATSPTFQGALFVCVAPFIAKVMDTVSSEVGKGAAGPTFSLLRFRRVAPGAEGGVSLAGTAGGLLAAGLLAAPIVFLGWGGWVDAGLLVAIALAANVFESLWGEWAARRGIEDGPQTNFLMTLLAAILAWTCWIAL